MGHGCHDCGCPNGCECCRACGKAPWACGCASTRYEPDAPPPVMVAIDPGLNHCAMSTWVGDKLQAACLVRQKYEPGMERADKWRIIGKAVGSLIPAGADLVIEVPQIYTRQHSKGDPNDLIDIAGVAGAIIGAAPARSVEWSPLPKEWKGNLPKEVTAQRVMNALRPDEHKAIQPCPPSLMHNVYDAIHLGLVYLKREGLRS